MTDSESKRTEYLWDQMSVMERCEVLRDRMNTLSQCIDVANDALWDASGTVDSPIRDIARRVERVESVSARLDGTTTRNERELTDLARRVAEIEKGNADPFTTKTGDVLSRITITGSEYERLRRIEEAARGVDAASQRGFVACSAEALMPFEKLRDALDSEPKR